jgi:hypothetical protein
VADLRNQLFSAIHRTWLKPQGFQKKGRRITKEFSPGVSVEVVLESYPTTPYGPYRFSIELIAMWREVDQPPIAYQMSLPSYATMPRAQFWTFSTEPEFEAVAQEATRLFESVALPTIQEMTTLEGLAKLFERIPVHVGLFRYYGYYLDLLGRLGRVQAQRDLLRRVIQSDSRQDVIERAKQELMQLE